MRVAAMKVQFLVLVMLSTSYAFGQTSLSGAGITFPDGSTQVTAAITPAAWPQQCQVEVDPGEDLYPTCYMYGGSDPTWSGTNGVPTGYFFLVTNVIITPSTSIDTGELGFYLYHISGCDNGTVGGTGLARLVQVRVVPDTQSWVYDSSAPFLVLPAGSCLRVDAFIANTATARVQFNGYLTTDPSHFRP